MNNNTNYDMANRNFTIPWKYPIADVNDYTTIRDYDYYPLKGIHSDAVKITDVSKKSINPDNGFVGWDESWHYIMTGLEINGTVGNSVAGYGILFNNVNTNGWMKTIYVDGVIIHDVDTLGSSYPWFEQGTGLALNNTDYGQNNVLYLSLYNIEIYNCHSNGIGIAYSQVDEGRHIWIHDGSSGSTGLFVSTYGKIDLYSSTIENQGHWGVLVAGSNSEVHLYNDIISGSGAYDGIATSHGLDEVDLEAYECSIFNNARYGVYATKNTNSHIRIADNIFYGNHGSTDSFDLDHIQVYTEDHSNISNYNPDTLTKGNYYNDWVNNNNTNDNNGDGIVD